MPVLLQQECASQCCTATDDGLFGAHWQKARRRKKAGGRTVGREAAVVRSAAALVCRAWSKAQGRLTNNRLSSVQGLHLVCGGSDRGAPHRRRGKKQEDAGRRLQAVGQ